MFTLIKQVFIALLSFCRYLATKCLSLNYGSCVIRPTLIELNPTELNYYPYMVSLDKCNGIRNAVDDLPTKMYVPRKTKDVNVKVFNMIARINEVTTLLKHTV